MEGTRVWRGVVKPGARDEHERFVEWLKTPEAELQYSKFLLSSYTLAQDGDALTVVMGATEPPPIIRFLRNPRMWPTAWEFQSSGPGEMPAEDTIRVRWRRGA